LIPKAVKKLETGLGSRLKNTKTRPIRQ